MNFIILSFSRVSRTRAQIWTRNRLFQISALSNTRTRDILYIQSRNASTLNQEIEASRSRLRSKIGEAQVRYDIRKMMDVPSSHTE